MDAYYELHSLEERFEVLGQAQASNFVHENVVQIERLLLIEAYGQRLLEEIGKTEIAIIAAQEKVDQAMARYIEASKDEKAISLLKEKRRAEYVEQALKGEMQFLDEISVQRIGNQRFNATHGE